MDLTRNYSRSSTTRSSGKTSGFLDLAVTDFTLPITFIVLCLPSSHTALFCHFTKCYYVFYQFYLKVLFHYYNNLSTDSSCRRLEIVVVKLWTTIYHLGYQKTIWNISAKIMQDAVKLKYMCLLSCVYVYVSLSCYLSLISNVNCNNFIIF